MPYRLDPCDCGGERVTTERDGLCVSYFCALCGSWLADLMENSQP